MVKKIIDNGYAYEKNGSVYLDVNKYNKDYHMEFYLEEILKIQLKEPDSLINKERKIALLIFAIWKKASKDHIMRWASPWGQVSWLAYGVFCNGRKISWQDIRHSWWRYGP